MDLWLKGSIPEKTNQKASLEEQGIAEFEGMGWVIPEECLLASLVFMFCTKPEGWKLYKENYLEHNVCTLEEYKGEVNGLN